jgi:hypothetical protein
MGRRIGADNPDSSPNLNLGSRDTATYTPDRVGVDPHTVSAPLTGGQSTFKGSHMAERSDADLKEGLKHVGYELYMLAESAAQLAATVWGSVEHNAYLEAQLLHARSLIDFFVVVKDEKSYRPDDMRRTEFAREWTPAPAEAVVRLRAAPKVIHKHLAHLTWERINTAGTEWKYVTIAGDVVDVARAWNNHLAADGTELWEVLMRPLALSEAAVRRGRVQATAITTTSVDSIEIVTTT